MNMAAAVARTAEADRERVVAAAVGHKAVELMERRARKVSEK